VSLLRLSPSESRFTRLRLVALLLGPPGGAPPGSSPLPPPPPPLNGHPGFSAGLRPFQKTARCEDEDEVEKEKEKGHPRLSPESAPSPPASPPPPGLSSPQSEPTELLNDSEEILRDDMVLVVLVVLVVLLLVVVMVVMVMVVMRKSVLSNDKVHVADSSDWGEPPGG